MSPRCPTCNRIQTGIDATADGHEIQPCGCNVSDVPLSDLESPFVDRGKGVATDGGRQDAPAIQLHPTDVAGPGGQADDVAFLRSALGGRYDIEVRDDPGEIGSESETVVLRFEGDEPGLTFVEAEDEDGSSVRVGEWEDDGEYKLLKIDRPRTVVPDGGRTIVGSPSNRSETADMSDLSSDFAEDFDGSPDSHIVPCRQCGAMAGEPCELYGGEDAGEPKGSPHSTRRTDARSERGEGDE